MKTAIIIHGMPSKVEYLKPENSSPSNSHWLPWLQKQLIINGILTQTPEMPTPYEPRYEEWKKVFEQFDVDENTVLVGHSCGGGFLVRYLSENKVKVRKVILVAPWIDPNHEERELVADFFDFEISPTLNEPLEGITVFISKDDDDYILESVNILENNLKEFRVQRFEDKGHFVFRDMGTNEFPELLAEIK